MGATGGLEDFSTRKVDSGRRLPPPLIMGLRGGRAGSTPTGLGGGKKEPGKHPNTHTTSGVIERGQRKERERREGKGQGSLFLSGLKSPVVSDLFMPLAMESTMGVW